MVILSITFHTAASHFQEWALFIEDELVEFLNPTNSSEKYLLSEVESEMLAEGKNTNLLLFFENEERKQQFLQTEFTMLENQVLSIFGDSVMIFKTHLHLKKSRW